MDYEGSIVIDRDLMDEVGFLPFEKVLVANITNGQRFETYVLQGERGTGAVELNGATARLGQAGDRVIIFSFAWVNGDVVDEHEPRIIQVDENNNVVRRSFAS